ncbi:MAG: hypothetical protein QFB89_01285 [Pseudomonadota bacterium]|nr:hypothetical protein [Pseudomonadota bacterium]
MTSVLKMLKPGIAVALGAMILAGLAIAVKRAADFDVDLDFDWDDLPA